MKTFFSVSVSLFAIVAAFFLSASLVFAQDSAGFTLKPAVVEEKIEPGTRRNGVLKVTNLAQEPRTVYFAK